MFGSEDDKIPVMVELTRTDGQMMNGALKISHGSNITRLLNSELTFLEFEGHDGVKTMLAKSVIALVVAVKTPRAA